MNDVHEDRGPESAWQRAALGRFNAAIAAESVLPFCVITPPRQRTIDTFEAGSRRMPDTVRFDIRFGLRLQDGHLPPKPGALRVGSMRMKAAIPVSLPPLIDPAVTERRLHVKLGDRDEHISLKPEDVMTELVQALDTPDLTVTLSDITPGGEGPESDPVTVSFSGSDFPPPKPGQIRVLAARAVSDDTPNVPDFGGTTTPDQPIPTPDQPPPTPDQPVPAPDQPVPTPDQPVPTPDQPPPPEQPAPDQPFLPPDQPTPDVPPPGPLPDVPPTG
jgi:hypothetical protein